MHLLSSNKQASVRCLARHGKFLEIGKYDLLKNSNLGMECFLKDITFHGILLDSTWGEPLIYRVLDMVKEAIAEGQVKPLERTVFSHNKASSKFLLVTYIYLVCKLGSLIVWM